MFQITTKLDYGLILLRSLVLHAGEGPRSIKRIAQENRLPYHYLAQIAIPLKGAGIIKSHEGARGGYELARAPESITLKEVSTILTPEKKNNRCVLDDKGVCKKKGGCSVSPWWNQFNRRFQRLLSEMTLDDLL